MAAKPLTTEEINYLRSWYLTSIIGMDAVKAYFDRVHPPAVLETHLANDKLALESLKQDGIISKTMWEKMYPKPRVRPTSADFDITILICLLREMIQKVQSPRGGFDHLPHKADTSAGACLAIIKHYRNFLAHPDQEKLRALSSTKFNDLFTQVGKAIQVLGNNQYSSKITVAKKLNINNDIAQILEKIVTYEKQFQDLQEEVNRNSSQTRYQEKKSKELHEKYEEIENDQKEVKDSHQQVIDQMSEIRSKLKLQKEALEKRVKEQKQLAATQIKHGKQIQSLEQEAGSMKKKQEDQRKDMKELTEKHFAITSQTEGLEKTATEHSNKLDECKMESDKIREVQTQHIERFENLEQKTESLNLKEEVHGKDIKDLQENQQNQAVRNVIGAVRRPESSVHSTKQLCTDVGQRSDNSSIFLPDITNSSSQKTEFIKRYYDQLPKEYKVGYYDVMILYSLDDRSEAEKFCDHLNRDIYPKQPGKIKAVLYDGPEFEGISLSKFEHFDEGFKRCTFTFVYLTKQFVECDWSRFLAETCLMEAICNPDKKWCFVPVYTVPKQRADFKIPIQINPLKEICYYNPDKFYLGCVRRLIGDKIYQREENDKILEEECFKFLVEKVGEDKANDQRLLNEHEDQ